MNTSLLDTLSYPFFKVSIPSVARHNYFRGMGREDGMDRKGDVLCAFTSDPRIVNNAASSNLITVTFVDVNGIYAPQQRHYALISTSGNMYPFPAIHPNYKKVYDYLEPQLLPSSWRCFSVQSMSAQQMADGSISHVIMRREFPRELWNKPAVSRKKSSMLLYSNA